LAENEVPRSSTVTASNIVAAVVYGDQYQKKRIESWRRINRQVFRDLTVPYRESAPAE
jgi:hypothetical protein